MDITKEYSVLLWTLFVLLLWSTETSGDYSSHQCPQGQIAHTHSPQWGRAFITCCFPTRCGVGQRVESCRTNGTNDTCQQCQAQTNQSQRTSSYNIKDCTSWPLDEHCKKYVGGALMLDLEDDRTKRCLCNIEVGMRFVPPEIIFGAHMDAFCQRTSTKCLKGHEPTLNGSCRRCPAKYFKTESSFKLCERKTDCHRLGLKYLFTSTNTWEDHRCSEPVPEPTPNPHTVKPYIIRTQKPIINPDPRPRPNSSGHTPTTTANSVVIPVDGAAGVGDDDNLRSGPSLGGSQDGDLGEAGGSSSSSSMVGPIVGIIIFLIIVIVIIGVILFCRKRRGLTICCGARKNCSDAEKNIRHNPSLMAEPHQRNKIILGNCGGPTRGGGREGSTSGSSGYASGGSGSSNVHINPLSSSEHNKGNNNNMNGHLPYNHQYTAVISPGGEGDDDVITEGIQLQQQHFHQQQQPHTRHAHFMQGEELSTTTTSCNYGNGDSTHQMFPPASMFPASPGQNTTTLANTNGGVGSPSGPRHGILRNGGPSWPRAAVHAGPYSNQPISNMDSIGREKLQVQGLAREANLEAGGENDPLLVSEPSQHPGQRPGLVSSGFPSNSQHPFQTVLTAPPTSNNPVHASSPSIASSSPHVGRVPGAGKQRWYAHHQYPHHHNTQRSMSTGSSSYTAGLEVNFAPGGYIHGPPGVVATFTRSSSVIATPEGEVDEDDIEAQVPRFSQLLPAEGDPDASVFNDDEGEDSPEDIGPPDNHLLPRGRTEESGAGGGRDTTTTQQIRSPSQRLFSRYPPEPLATSQVKQMYQGVTATNTYQPTETPSRLADDSSTPDHHIMTLKEQQLAESLTSPPHSSLSQHESSSLSSSLPSQLKHPSDVSETEALKTVNPSTTGQAGQRLTPEPQGSQETDLKTRLSPIEDSDVGATSLTNAKSTKDSLEGTEETKPFVVGRTCSSDAPNIETNTSSGGGGGSNQNTLERKRDGQAMAARDRRRMSSGGSTASSNSSSSHHNNNHNVTDNSGYNTATARKLPYTRTVSFEEEEENEESRLHQQLPVGLLGGESDASDQTQQKRSSRDNHQSSSSSSSSSCRGNSGSDSSPSRANAYQRSQSESVACNNPDSPHKPPPRSNSEEKPQSNANRPVAKVRPMPASDSNLPTEVPGNILAYSSEESDEEGGEHQESLADTTEETEEEEVDENRIIQTQAESALE